MKFLIIKRSALWLAFCSIVLCALLSMPLGENAMSAVFFGDSLRKVPIYNVETDKKQVAISFDAAWGADKTAKIVELLDEYSVGATFFLVGFWVDKYPDEVKLIHEHGYEIGTHSNTHPDLAKMSAEAVNLELTESIKKINAVVDTKVELFRAPFGAYNNTVLDMATSLGLQTIQWDVDSLDWKGLSGAEISKRVLSRVKNGSIVLFHNNSDHILDALPIILDRLKKQGYEISAIGDLVYKDDYSIDRAGVQKLNSENEQTKNQGD